MRGAEGGSPLLAWEYDRASSKLKLSLLPWEFNGMTAFFEGDRSIVPVLSNVSGFQTSRTRTRTGDSVRSNAYGASTTVETFREETFGVAAFSPDHVRQLPASGMRFGSFYEHEITIEPEAARALTVDLRLVVTGVAKDYEGRAVVCGTNYQEPTFRNPTEVLGRTCLLPAEITSIAFVDGRDGSVLREWR